MNDIVNKFLLTGDKSMPEMYLKQQRFTHCDCGPFTKNREGTKNSVELHSIKKPSKICIVKRSEFWNKTIV